MDFTFSPFPFFFAIYNANILIIYNPIFFLSIFGLLPNHFLKLSISIFHKFIKFSQFTNINSIIVILLSNSAKFLLILYFIFINKLEKYGFISF